VTTAEDLDADENRALTESVYTHPEAILLMQKYHNRHDVCSLEGREGVLHFTSSQTKIGCIEDRCIGSGVDGESLFAYGMVGRATSRNRVASLCAVNP
jgi:hypothetical protein